MDDFDVTPAMRAYLAAFDAWLRADAKGVESPELDRRRGEALAGLFMDVRPLTRKEANVLRLRVSGVSRIGAAGRLGMAPVTCSVHWNRIRTKLGTSDLEQLRVWAVDRGLVEP